MVVSTDSLASAAGLSMLQAGGNAVDAAVATHFALAVVNPEAGNIGGGGFMVARMADDTRAALDFREKAPLAASADMYLDAEGRVTDAGVIGHLASGVPGSVAGMREAWERFGTLPWSDLLQPAIRLARDGFVIGPRHLSSVGPGPRSSQRFPSHRGRVSARRTGTRSRDPCSGSRTWHALSSRSPSTARRPSTGAGSPTPRWPRWSAAGASSRTRTWPPTRPCGETR